jgi:hypothetical protein
MRSRRQQDHSRAAMDRVLMSLEAGFAPGAGGAAGLIVNPEPRRDRAAELLSRSSIRRDDDATAAAAVRPPRVGQRGRPRGRETASGFGLGSSSRRKPEPQPSSSGVKGWITAAADQRTDRQRGWRPGRGNDSVPRSNAAFLEARAPAADALHGGGCCTLEPARWRRFPRFPRVNHLG